MPSRSATSPRFTSGASASASRKTLDRKERKLAEAGRLAYGWAKHEHERLALIDILFAQNAAQFAELGVSDIFDVNARAFYREPRSSMTTIRAVSNSAI